MLLRRECSTQKAFLGAFLEANIEEDQNQQGRDL